MTIFLDILELENHNNQLSEIVLKIVMEKIWHNDCIPFQLVNKAPGTPYLTFECVALQMTDISRKNSPFGIINSC